MKLRWRKQQAFRSSDYWNDRYASGGNSGPGSYGDLATFKAEVINSILAELGITFVAEYGCGDGHNLGLYDIAHYVGYDISETAVAHCKSKWINDARKKFRHISEPDLFRAEMSMSLDVIFHLTEDATYEAYMRRLFDSASRYVLIYSSHANFQPSATHVRHRNFLEWWAKYRPDWQLIRFVPNRYPAADLAVDDPKRSFADFFLFGAAS